MRLHSTRTDIADEGDRGTSEPPKTLASEISLGLRRRVLRRLRDSVLLLLAAAPKDPQNCGDSSHTPLKRPPDREVNRWSVGPSVRRVWREAQRENTERVCLQSRVVRPNVIREEGDGERREEDEGEMREKGKIERCRRRGVECKSCGRGRYEAREKGERSIGELEELGLGEGAFELLRGRLDGRLQLLDVGEPQSRPIVAILRSWRGCGRGETPEGDVCEARLVECADPVREKLRLREGEGGHEMAVNECEVCGRRV